MRARTVSRAARTTFTRPCWQAGRVASERPEAEQPTDVKDHETPELAGRPRSISRNRLPRCPNQLLARPISGLRQAETRRMEANEYEERLVAALPGKVLTFLRAAGTRLEIRAALCTAGWSV